MEAIGTMIISADVMLIVGVFSSCVSKCSRKKNENKIIVECPSLPNEQNPGIPKVIPNW